MFKRILPKNVLRMPNKKKLFNEKVAKTVSEEVL